MVGILTQSASAYEDSVDCPVTGCDGRVPWDWDECTVCGRSIDPPNLRWARSERDQLDQHYEAARSLLAKTGREDVADKFETAAQDAVAVISMPIQSALMLVEDKALHENYHRGCGSSRLAAAVQDDIMRRTVDARLFGSAGQHISMAALSLDGLGLPSYGSVFFELKEMMCAARGSLLVENSFDFVARSINGRLPAGFRSAWCDRGKLAIVANAERLAADMGADSFPRVLLHSTGDRSTDRFMEVHLYGRWNADAILRARLMSPVKGDKFAEAMAERLGERLKARAIDWEMVA